MANRDPKIVWWRLSGSVTPSNLRSILANENISIDVPEIDQASAICRLANTFQHGRGKDTRHYSQVVHRDDVSIDIEIVQKKVNEVAKIGSRAKGVSVDCVTFDVGAQQWVSRGDMDNPATQSFISKADVVRQNHDYGFIRPNIVVPLLESCVGAFEVNPRTYVVPPSEANDDTLNALRRILAQIGDCRLSKLPISLAGDEALSDMQDEARGHVQSTLDDLIAKLDKWSDSSRRPKTDAVERTITEFAQLKASADLYRDVLQCSLEDLTNKIEEASSIARKLIDDDEDDWKASPGLVNKYENLVADTDLYPVVDGVQRIPVDALADIGLSKSACTYATYYSRSNSGGRALGALGYRGTLNMSDKVLIVRPLSGGPRQSAADVANETSPESATPGPVSKLDGKSTNELREVYSTVLGEDAPKDATRDDLVTAILAA